MGIPYWGRTPESFLDLGFFAFSKNVHFGNFPMEFGVWEAVQSTDAFCRIQTDGSSARTEPYGSIFNDFRDLDVFASVFGL